LLNAVICPILVASTKGGYSLAMKISHRSAGAGVPLRLLPPIAALLAFERAATLLSFRRAARELALSPSAVSHQIRGLERRFGVRFFVRSGRAVRLTADGERYLRAVSAGLATLEDASRDLLSRGHRNRTELHVSALPFFTSTVLIPALGFFKRRCPGLTVRIDTTHQYADFDHTQVDVAIRFGRERTAGLKLEPVLSVRGLPVCSPALGKDGLRKPRDLTRSVLIHVTQQSHAWSQWLADVGERDLTPRGELWFDTVPAALEAAEHGLGITLAMDPLVRAHKGFGRTLIAPFNTRSSQSQTLYLVTRPERSHEKSIEEFRGWLMDTVTRLVGSEAYMGGRG
jgi:LysR family transcriptional regulator, glycine cleavage system transcriptional activator